MSAKEVLLVTFAKAGGEKGKKGFVERAMHCLPRCFVEKSLTGCEKGLKNSVNHGPRQHAHTHTQVSVQELLQPLLTRA